MKNMIRFFVDLKKYGRYIWTSALAELRAEVASSYLNWMWWILDPIAFMLIYTFIFGTVFGRSEQFFSLFVFVGLTLWGFFNRTVSTSVSLITANRSLIKKVYVPKFILILKNMTVNFLKMMFAASVIVVMMIFYKVPATPAILYVIPAFIIFVTITFGVSLILAHFGVFISDLKNITRIGLRMVFYLSGIFFRVEGRLPEPYGYWFARLNPVAFLLTTIREALLAAAVPSWHWLSFWAVVSVLVVFVGINLVYKNENTYVKVI